MYCDGGGLYLQVTPAGGKTWIFRFRSPLTRKVRDMGLGPLHSLGLADARTEAAKQRTVLLRGLDPIIKRDQDEQQKALQAARAKTFAECAESYIQSHRQGWRNPKHADQWTNTLKTYANKVIGPLPVQDVDTPLVLKVLEPIWSTKAETASRVRGRIESILDWAKARGYRTGENPARWKGHLDQLLPAMSKKGRVTHHKAMPFTEIAGLITDIRQQKSLSALCLEFTILTAARTNEVTQARWEEFDLTAATWTVPASRMKAKKEHRVPLSPRAVAIARQLLDAGQEYVFPGTRKGKPICNMSMLKLLERMDVPVTVHGFRSSFRDWAAERTAYSHEVCEMALAHVISNAAEAAYRRGDLFEKRRQLMNAWAEYVNNPSADGEVVPLRQAA